MDIVRERRSVGPSEASVGSDIWRGGVGASCGEGGGVAGGCEGRRGGRGRDGDKSVREREKGDGPKFET